MGAGVFKVHENGLQLSGEYWENRQRTRGPADTALRESRCKNTGGYTEKRNGTIRNGKENFKK